MHDPSPPSQTEPSPERRRAAQYVRMSTEHQQYSTDNQKDVIREYADKHGFEITKTYQDEGKSGLKVSGRDAIKRLIEDVENGTAAFDAILVYDVSRWGRFQDADESAYYEYLCKRASIDVHYCAELFDNDGGPMSTVMKSVKRAMAGEYSRELSSKVFKGQCRLVELGYRQGGTCGYGLRRMLIDQNGNPKGILNLGEYKSLQTDRVILVPGPNEEIRIVNWMYRMFTQDGKTESEIADVLNSEGIKTDFDRKWTRTTVREVLTNEKYIGNNVYNRSSFKLKKKLVQNPPDMWVRCDSAFKPVVAAELFYVAQGIIQERNRRFSDEELLSRLKALIGKHETLSAFLIDSTEGMPASSCYRCRFGSLLAAYRLAGYVPDRDYGYVEANRHLRQIYPDFVEDLIEKLGSVGASVTRDVGTDLLLINEEYSATIVLSRCRQTRSGSSRWLVNIDQRVAPDITILARMDADNHAPTDYYFLPIVDIEAPKLLLCESNGVYLDTYHFDTLDRFAQLAARKRIEVAA